MTAENVTDIVELLSMSEPEVAALKADSALTRWRVVIESVRNDYLDANQRFPWIIGFSGGKDSTLVVHAVIDALMSIPPSRGLERHSRRKPSSYRAFGQSDEGNSAGR